MRYHRVMLARRCAPLSSALCLVAGCFSDGGAHLTQTATSAPPDSSTSQASTSAATWDATTGPDTTTTTGPDTTSTGPDPTSTGGTTTAAPGCADPKMCEPGDVMDLGVLCDPCGRSHAVCQQDCTWGPPECAQDLSSCVYWVLDADTNVWSRVALPQPPPVHAPTGPIAAAFELETESRIVALTQTTYHVLVPPTHEWIASGDLTELFPGFPGPVLQAFSILDPNSPWYMIYLLSGDWVDYYWLEPGSLVAEPDGDDACCWAWNDELSPASADAIRDIFLDLPNNHEWAGGQYSNSACLEGAPVWVDEYAAWIEPTTVYIEEADACFELLYETPYAEFPPFTVPGAPPGDLVGGAAMFADSLYVFAGE